MTVLAIFVSIAGSVVAILSIFTTVFGAVAEESSNEAGASININGHEYGYSTVLPTLPTDPNE